jgi:hypothetical protein
MGKPGGDFRKPFVGLSLGTNFALKDLGRAC